jgi:cysteine desulfurase/selenocysteine lyase
MEFFNISGTIRASFSFYNSKNEVKRFVDALGIAFKMLS